MKSFLLLISITLLMIFHSCNSNTIIKPPENLIPKEQMVDLLTDMYIANAAFNLKNTNLEKKIDYIPLVYEKYKIDSARYHASNIYYMSRIDEYEAIYKEVEMRLKTLKEEKEKRKKKDSLELRPKEFLD